MSDHTPSSDDRCFFCRYDLSGHERPTICPECGRSSVKGDRRRKRLVTILQGLFLVTFALLWVEFARLTDLDWFHDAIHINPTTLWLIWSGVLLAWLVWSVDAADRALPRPCWIAFTILIITSGIASALHALGFLGRQLLF